MPSRRICVHGGESPDADGALDPPIVLSSAFAFTSAEHAARAFRGEEDAYIYGRWGNPTVDALEAKLAAVEGAEAACATASGMAAIAGVVLASCEAGDHVVAPRSMYAESARLLRERLPKLGITTTFVDGTVAAYAAADHGANAPPVRGDAVESDARGGRHRRHRGARALAYRDVPGWWSTARSRRRSRSRRSRSAPISSCIP